MPCVIFSHKLIFSLRSFSLMDVIHSLNRQFQLEYARKASMVNSIIQKDVDAIDKCLGLYPSAFIRSKRR